MVDVHTARANHRTGARGGPTPVGGKTVRKLLASMVAVLLIALALGASSAAASSSGGSAKASVQDFDFPM
jgi:hypothetical protein